MIIKQWTVYAELGKKEMLLSIVLLPLGELRRKFIDARSLREVSTFRLLKHQRQHKEEDLQNQILKHNRLTSWSISTIVTSLSCLSSTIKAPSIVRLFKCFLRKMVSNSKLQLQHSIVILLSSRRNFPSLDFPSTLTSIANRKRKITQPKIWSMMKRLWER